MYCIMHKIKNKKITANKKNYIIFLCNYFNIYYINYIFIYLNRKLINFINNCILYGFIE